MTASEKLTIETPEQIALEFPLAGVGSRFLALAFDTLVQILLGVIIFAGWMGLTWLLVPVARIQASVWALAAAVLLGFLVMFGYFALFEILWQGQTPGKRLLKLRVISTSGRPITTYQALLRNLLRLADQLPALYAIGITSVLLTARSQRLGDLAASTVVVHERPTLGEYVTAPGLATASTWAGAGGVAAARVGQTEARRERLNARRLTHDEIALIDRFLQRRADLEWEIRERTASEIAARVRQRLELPPDGDHEELLERVTTEYRTFR